MAQPSTTVPRRFPAFLAPASRAALIAIAASDLWKKSWELGRQKSGYEKLALRDSTPARANARLFDSLLAAARVTLKVDYREWDAYLIRYRAGSSIPPHRDPNDGGRHLRLNAIARAADPGTGELRLDGDVFELDAGDAVLFRSDEILHQVTQVAGERLILSVGCVF